jgi:hypothetical protein
MLIFFVLIKKCVDDINVLSLSLSLTNSFIDQHACNIYKREQILVILIIKSSQVFCVLLEFHHDVEPDQIEEMNILMNHRAPLLLLDYHNDNNN